MNKMKMWLKSKAKCQKGQTMVEYALLVVLIALVVAVAIPSVTNAISGSYAKAATKLTAP